MMKGVPIMMRSALLIALALVSCRLATAEVEFLGLDLGRDDNLLFTARAELPADGSYDSLFVSGLAAGKVTQLSAYPEHMNLVDGGRRLQVQNRFGLFSTDSALSNLAPLEGYPSFARGSGIASGRLPASAPSPNGAWVLALDTSSPAYSRLVMVETATAKRSLISERVESEVEDFPARWSPDSRYFVYAKGGALYYYSVDQLAGTRVLSEELRRIGNGSIRSARWGKDASLFYLRGTSLYRILPAEFFPQALYRGLAGMGALAGSIPFPYDPNFDDFWVSTEGSRIVLSKGGRNLFLLYLDPDEFKAGKKVSALPYLFLQGGTTVRDVLWPARGPVTVFADTISGSTRSPGAYRFDAPADPADLDLAPAVTEFDVAGARELILSPDETRVAIVTKNAVFVRSYEDWKLETTIMTADALHALWTDARGLVVASSHLIEKVDLDSGSRDLVALSQIDAAGRDEAGAIIARSGGRFFSQGAEAAGAGAWKEIQAYSPRPSATGSDSYRVYLENATAGPFKNLVMVRSIKAYGTTPVLPAPAAAYAPFPDRDEPRTGGVFDHGSRIRRRELALVFDALDSAEGITPVLNTLKDYGLSATFFVNGEFVRRNPGATRILAGSGHEIGSMFFTTVDPTDARFSADREYIRRGLARAEDEWYSATGKELALLWHTPYYSVNDDILDAGASMNYVCVGRDIDSLDWVSAKDADRLPGSYLSAHEMVERIVATARPGSIVPIRIGVPDGGRDDYLFLELALLVNALEDRGYDIVPVSTLIEHAK
jgi:peptidoglycan/xylan/chitin deacetylase (PgdA/CDA1 family)